MSKNNPAVRASVGVLGGSKSDFPILEKAVRAAGGKVKLVKINIDEHPGVAGQLGVRSIPAVYAFDQGRPVDGFMGAMPEGEVRRFAEKVIAGAPAAPPPADSLEAVREVTAQGEVPLSHRGVQPGEEAEDVQLLRGKSPARGVDFQVQQVVVDELPRCLVVVCARSEGVARVVVPGIVRRLAGRRAAPPAGASAKRASTRSTRSGSRDRGRPMTRAPTARRSSRPAAPAPRRPSPRWVNSKA